MTERTIIRYSIFIVIVGLLLPVILIAQNEPLTVAEASGYTRTSLYTDVMNFIENLQLKTPYLRVETICKSAEGRDVPLLVIGRPLPASPLDLKYDSRAVVYIQANIHAGEVEGKEASLMLARDILLNEKLTYLDDLVILIAPIFNPDGNEKIDPRNRRSQNGPESVGIRYNGQNLDLNRDAMKLESSEVRGMVCNVLNRWDPVLMIDCHTTDGSYHQEPVTFVWGFNPNGDRNIIEFLRTKVTPFIQKNMKNKYGLLSIVYGNFMDYKDPEKGWRPAGPQVRYITNYIGLRNRLALLNENYSYADFKTRVRGCYAFLRSVLEFCAVNREKIKKLITDADRRTIERGMNPQTSDSFAVEYDLKPYEEKITIRGYEMIPRESGYPRFIKTDKEKIYKVPYYCKYIPRRSVRFPHAYLIQAYGDRIVKKLIEHGILVERLKEPAVLRVESFKIKKIEAAKRPYQGHYMNSIKGEYEMVEKEFPKGTLFVQTAQRLGSLVAYLLEPESDDGLVVWNFFDRYLVRQWGGGFGEFPIYKLYEPVNLVKERCVR